MITIFVHRNGRTDRATSIDRTWLNPAAGACIWVDLAAPSIPESLVLSDTFAFHPLSVEDAMETRQYPKAEAYDGYLYVVLHGIHFRPVEHGFATHDVDFFVGPAYLVTVHDGDSRSIVDLRDNAERNPKILSEGPVALFHRIVDALVDHYRPEVEKLEDRIDALETKVFDDPTPAMVREILAQKRDVVRKLTDAMVSVEGEAMRPVTWVVVEEVKSGDWGIGGKSLTTADVKALAAGKPTG